MVDNNFHSLIGFTIEKIFFKKDYFYLILLMKTI